MEPDQIIRASASGKVIISGEHAAVYGRPALAMASKCKATATLKSRDGAGISFDVPNLDYRLDFSTDHLKALYEKLLDRYQLFLEGSVPIHEVMDHPIELIPFAFAGIWKRTGFQPLPHISVALNITIPVGCGMGSSAAVGLCVIKAAMEYFGLPLSQKEQLEESMACERLMHGHPSGVDSSVSLFGGAVRFENGELSSRTIPNWSIRLVNSGKPSATTGECVAAVREQFCKSDPVWNAFETVTNAIDRKLDSPVDGELLDLIKENHGLLRRIGVVPDRVHQMVGKIEAQGAAAKVCGAGACRGDAAGIIMVVGDCELTPLLEESNFKLIERY